MRPYFFGALLCVSALVIGTPAHADIPAGYTGAPYKGTPWPIPGRIDFENFDLGGYNVGFKTEHHSKGAPIACSGGDYRTDDDQPTVCKTNQGTEVDKLADGTLYPSAANPVSYYIGACRPTDWVQITVNVKTAGTYKLSSTWASGADVIDVTLFFNGVQKANYKTSAASDYHKWVPGPQFATIDLDAGVQVFKFVANREHVNYDYIQFSLVTATGLDDGAGSAGAGSGGATAGGAGGTNGTSGGAAITGGTGGTGGTSAAGDNAGGALSGAVNSAGADAVAGGSGAPMSVNAGAGGAGNAGAASVLPTPVADKGGCTVSPTGSASRSRAAFVFAALGGAFALLRRRPRRTLR